MELLAPAGNLEKLKWAAVYGADAVYFGTEFGSLRSFAGNFSFEEAEKGLSFLHARGKRGYAALNIYPFSNEIDSLKKTAHTLDEMGVNALIVSDLGLFMELKRLRLRTALHISTQANSVNYQTVLAYGEMGAKRVNLARELSLEQIQEIQKAVEGKVETETFIHGAVCFSYSGRCAISDYLAGFRANRGECKHPCRWKYALVEETRPGQYMPVFEDERGLYLFNSRELALFQFVRDLEKAGVASVKIEGRMKSIHYIATVVSFYRQVLDGKDFSWEKGLELLRRVPNRGYSTGFMKGKIDDSDYERESSASQAESVFVGNVTEETMDGKQVIRVRNTIMGGEELEVLSPSGALETIAMPKVFTTTLGRQAAFVNNSQSVVLDTPLKPYALLRKIIKPS